MINEFEFKGFEPDEDMEAEAQAVIEEIQDSAPNRVIIAALIHFDGTNYSCAMDVYLRRGTVTASVSDSNLSKALMRTKEIVLEKLSTHKETKFFTRKSEALTNQYKNTFGFLKQT